MEAKYSSKDWRFKPESLHEENLFCKLLRLLKNPSTLIFRELTITVKKGINNIVTSVGL